MDRRTPASDGTHHNPGRWLCHLSQRGNHRDNGSNRGNPYARGYLDRYPKPPLTLETHSACRWPVLPEKLVIHLLSAMPAEDSFDDSSPVRQQVSCLPPLYCCCTSRAVLPRPSS